MHYSIGEIAKRTNLTTHTLRYYEKEGLLKKVFRKQNGVRCYTDKDIEHIGIITCLKESIADIKSYMNLCQCGKDSINTRLSLFQKQRTCIHEQIEHLKIHLQTIDYKIWYYENLSTFGDENDPDNCIKMRMIYETQKKTSIN